MKDDSTTMIVALMRTFPSLQHYANQVGDRFDPQEVRDLFHLGNHGSGATHAMNFILDLWAGTTHRFDLFAAMNAWDYHHKKAFAAWAANPVQP